MKYLKSVLKDLKQLRWQNFIFLFFAGCINAFGVTVFLAPVNLYDSGISGTSILLSQITPEYMTLSVFLLILNIPLFLIGFKKQGINFRVTGIIRTRPKTVLFKSFRRFTLERRQPSCGLNPKNPIKITRFQVEDFLQCGFLARQGTKRRKSFVDFRVF